MSTRQTLATAMLTTTMLASVALAETVNFDNLKTGAPPPGRHQIVTRWPWRAVGRGPGNLRPALIPV